MPAYVEINSTKIGGVFMKTVEMPKDVRDYFASGTKTIKKVTANEDYHSEAMLSACS